MCCGTNISRCRSVVGSWSVLRYQCAIFHTLSLAWVICIDILLLWFVSRELVCTTIPMRDMSYTIIWMSHMYRYIPTVVRVAAVLLHYRTNALYVIHSTDTLHMQRGSWRGSWSAVSYEWVIFDISYTQRGSWRCSWSALLYECVVCHTRNAVRDAAVGLPYHMNESYLIFLTPSAVRDAALGSAVSYEWVTYHMLYTRRGSWRSSWLLDRIYESFVKRYTLNSVRDAAVGSAVSFEWVVYHMLYTRRGSWRGNQSANQQAAAPTVCSIMNIWLFMTHMSISHVACTIRSLSEYAYVCIYV